MPVSLADAANVNDLRHYFEYSASGVDVVSDGLQQISFGEYLVDRGLLDRCQLLQALQRQDRTPGARVGECVAALGFIPIGAIEKLHLEFAKLATVTV